MTLAAEGSGLRWLQPWPESSSMQVRVLSHWKERHPGVERRGPWPGQVGLGEGSSWWKNTHNLFAVRGPTEGL